MILAVILLPGLQALATDQYVFLAPLGDKTSVSTNKPWEEYLPFAFNLLIGLSAAFAVVMIVIGGFQYMTTDAIQAKSAGKERIKNAVLGLVLVISAWLILNEINPELLKLKLDITPAPTASPTTGGASGSW